MARALPPAPHPFCPQDHQDPMTKSLARIQVEGFRSLKQVDLSFGAITALIGPNGSGKSNLLSFLRMLPLLRSRSLRVHVGQQGGASALLHYGPEVTPELRFRLEFEEETGAVAYAARLGAAAGDQFVFLEETVEHRPAGTATFQFFSLGAGHMESRLEEAAADPDNEPARSVGSWLSQMAYFHFHDTSLTSALRRNSRQVDTAYLRSDGSNLAAYLRAIKLRATNGGRAAWHRISHAVNRVAPHVKALEPVLVDPDHPETSAVRLDWIDERDHVFESHHLSDGTLRSVALFTALEQPEDRLPAFIAIDEPELGIDPVALLLLASTIRSVSAHRQVVLATQSPILVDELEPSQVVITERRHGETKFRRLDPEKLASWLEDYTVSELYEKNVLGAMP
jgi:predicted ATPase